MTAIVVHRFGYGQTNKTRCGRPFTDTTLVAMLGIPRGYRWCRRCEAA